MSRSAAEKRADLFFLRKGNNVRQAHCLPLEMGIIKCGRNMNAKVQHKNWTISFKIFDDFWRNPGRKLQQKLGSEQLIIMRFLVETKEVWIWNIDHAYYIYFWDKIPILWLNHFAELTTNICKSQLCNFWNKFQSRSLGFGCEIGIYSVLGPTPSRRLKIVTNMYI